MEYKDNNESGREPTDSDSISDAVEPNELLEEELPPQQDPTLPSEAINLVPAILATENGKDFLKKLADRVCSDFKDDWDSASDWREKRAVRTKLIVGALDEKSFPWEGCANVHVPIMAQYILRISTRIYSELFPDRDLFFNNKIPGNEETSRVTSLYMDSQFRHDMEDFKRQQRRAIFEFIAHGDCVFDSYYDGGTDKSRHEHLSCEEFVFPYVWKTTKIDMSDVPRKTKILRKYKRELKELERSGFYVSVDKFCDEQSGGELEQVVRDVVSKFEGKTEGKDKPFVIIEQHTFAKLPDELMGEDDREVPVVISVGLQSQEVLGMYIREYDDPMDKARYQKQTEEMTRYMSDVSQFTEASMEESKVDGMLASDAVPNDEELAIRESIMADPLVQPEKPQWLELAADGSPVPPLPVKRIPIERFTRNSCIENPDGAMGLGVGLLLQPFNEGANTMLNQFTDAASLANGGSLITDKSFPDGAIAIAPGKVTRLDNFSSEGIDKRIFQLKFAQANPQLIEATKMLIDFAGGIASAPEVMSGEKTGAETYRGQAGRIEQATKQMSVIASNYIEILDQLVHNQARLNSQFLPEIAAVTVFDPRTFQHIQLAVTREMFIEAFDVVFTADVRFASRAQRIAEADDTFSLLTRGLPPELAKLCVKPEVFAEALRKCLKARGEDELLPFINTAEEARAIAMMPPPMPPGMAPPGGPGQAAGPGGGPPPSIPDGQSGEAPGQSVGASHPPEDSPVEAGAPQ